MFRKISQFDKYIPSGHPAVVPVCNLKCIFSAVCISDLSTNKKALAYTKGPKSSAIPP